MTRQDNALERLLCSVTQALGQTDEKLLWFVDENLLWTSFAQHSADHFLSQGESLAIITNRYDLHQGFVSRGLNSQFSDFAINPQQHHTFTQVFFRISKEKALTHRVVNQAFQLLKAGGKLTICGEKNEGIKAYANKACALFNSTQRLDKQGTTYLASFVKPIQKQTDFHWLDDSHYDQLRTISTHKHIAIQSKPGLFGWQKIDQGSAFLVHALPTYLNHLPQTPNSLLDLGCGYGYLLIMTAHLSLKRRVGTDNNAAALGAARENIRSFQLNADILASDCGKQLTERFDIILCNPPFHQGFSINSELTDKFLDNTYRLLTDQGSALFVVNRFIPLARKARAIFSQVNMIAENASFSLWHLAR